MLKRSCCTIVTKVLYICYQKVYVIQNHSFIHRMELEMEQKPNLVYVLIILWIIIGIIFLGLLATYTSNYLEQLESRSNSMFGGDEQWNALSDFYFVMYSILFLGIAIMSFLLIYGTFFQKNWSWLIGIITASSLSFWVWLGLVSIGSSIIMERIDQMFANLYSGFTFISYIMMIFLIPILLIILTRPNVKAYFGKT